MKPFARMIIVSFLAFGYCKRVYPQIMADHLDKYRQMIFLSVPRQVGKATLATECATAYVGWDKDKDRQTILSGADALKASSSSNP